MKEVNQFSGGEYSCTHASVEVSSFVTSYFITQEAYKDVLSELTRRIKGNIE